MQKRLISRKPVSCVGDNIVKQGVMKSVAVRVFGPVLSNDGEAGRAVKGGSRMQLDEQDI